MFDDRRLARNDVVALAVECFGVELGGAVADVVRPGLRLIPSSSDVCGGTGFSFGGRPGCGGQWPWRGDVEPLEYLARLDLSVVVASGVVPGLQQRGVVDVFVAPVVDDGEGGFVADPDETAGHRFVVVPADLPGDPLVPPEDVYEYPVVALRPVLVHTAPGWESARELLGPSVVEEWHDRFDDFADALVERQLGPDAVDAPVHQVGGWSPSDYQASEVMVSGVWTHLLTIASDEDAEFGFLDGGLLVWFVAEDATGLGVEGATILDLQSA